MERDNGKKALSLQKNRGESLNLKMGVSKITENWSNGSFKIHGVRFKLDASLIVTVTVSNNAVKIFPRKEKERAKIGKATVGYYEASNIKKIWGWENKRLSVSPRKGKRKLEEGESSKGEATLSKKRKSATRMKAHDEKNDIEETSKEGSEMETNELEGEESWKDEEVGAEEEEGENESDNENPIHSASIGHDNSQPMVDKDDKDKEEKDMDSEREKNKEPEKEMAKDYLSEDKESKGEMRKEDDKIQKQWK
ncbi:uncharacterized protein LOC131859998 [Cryptomeria japonica]|uniref:uncharacterized protein LOC131859998 n=1 Tax=Cryptomeria japonica TaxID=3369 RepID=UPI0027DA08B0|nr:uncharacterized protein LOC131859998 [Cryptomeria japonica]